MQPHSTHLPQNSGARQSWAILCGLVLAVLLMAASYYLVLPDERARTLAVNTLTLMALTVWGSVPLGSLLAWLLVRTDLPGRKPMLLALAAMLWMPLYLQAGAWQAGFGVQGWYTLAWETSAWLTGWWAVVWIHSLAALPWVVMIVGGGLWLVEPELEEQALLDGSLWQVFWQVTLRRAWPAAVAAVFWVALSCGQEMTVTDLFQIRTYAEELYTQYAAEPDQGALTLLPGLALAGWLAMLGVVASAMLIAPSRRVSTRPRITFQLGHWKGPALCFVLLVLLVVWGVPVGNLLYKTGLVVTADEAGFHRSWSLLACLKMLASPLVTWNPDEGLALGEYVQSMFWTFLVGLCAAVLAVGVSAPLAWWAKSGGWKSWPVWCIAGCLLGVPGPAVGLTAIRVFNWPPLLMLYEFVGLDLYSHSIIPLVIVQAMRGLPLVLLMLTYVFHAVPRSVLEISAGEGASPARQLLTHGIRAYWPLVVLAGVVCQMLATAELGATILVYPPGLELLPVQVFNALHWGQENQVSSVCLVNMAGYVLLVCLLFRWLSHLPSRWKR